MIWCKGAPVHAGGLFYAFVNCFTTCERLAAFSMLPSAVMSRPTQEEILVKLILAILMLFPASVFANDCPGFLKFVKAHSQLKQRNDSQIQCFMTRPPKQKTKVFTFISGNVTVGCIVTGSYPYRQLSCSDAGQSFGRSLNN
ncbi:hypothetical protein [Bradyrhizobium sp. RDM4]|uniref:hypothetical protein n=1 Tax=Bradyrhizobium sp. RDM4 TaxID=3378765 RepID=UPI0038FC6564